MLNKDQADEFDSKLNFVEYLASFTNPEAVQKIKDGRGKKIGMDTDKEFSDMLKKKFGRQLADGDTGKALKPKEPFINISPPAQSSESKRNNAGAISVDFIKKYLDMDLDEITFHPSKK